MCESHSHVDLDAPMERGEGIAGRVAHLDAGSGDGEERETGDGCAGDAAERAVRAVMRDPEGGLLVGRCEGIDGTFGEGRYRSRAASRRCAGRWAWEWQTRGDGRDARHQSRAPREPGGVKAVSRDDDYDKRNEMSPRDLATRALERGG